MARSCGGGTVAGIGSAADPAVRRAAHCGPVAYSRGGTPDTRAGSMTRPGAVAYRRAVEETRPQWDGPPQWDAPQRGHERSPRRHNRPPWPHGGPPWRHGGPPWGRGRAPVFVLPMIAAVIQVIGSFGAQHDQLNRRPLDAVGVLLLLAGPAALVARRRHPVATLVAVAVVRGHRTAAWLVAGLLYGGHWALLVLRGKPTASWQTLVTVAAVMCLVLVAGEVARVTRERAA